LGFLPGQAEAVDVFLALGSNLGDRRGYLLGALEALPGSGIALLEVSSLYETPPLGFEAQPPFLNLVARGRCSLSPRDLLEVVQALEEEAGRDRPFPNAPRTLDIDIVLFGSRIVRAPGLRIPHPSWRRRSFVSIPLGEVGGGVVDPESGWRVSDVVNHWPSEPEEIHLVEGPPAL
jgi:2-amino-4-hydroxy-6-hydroxymethyldihydropteridine diphosphokinase